MLKTWINFFFTLEVQQEFLLMEVDLVVRLIGLRDFGRDAAITLMGYNSEVRNLILGLENMPMLSLLEAKLDENLIKATFTDENLQLARTSICLKNLQLIHWRMKSCLY